MLTQAKIVLSFLLWLFVLATLMDIASFVVMMHAGGMALEANTLVVGTLYGLGGFSLVLSAKVAVVAYLLFALAAQSRVVVGYFVILAGIFVGTLGTWTNVLAILSVV